LALLDDFDMRWSHQGAEKALEAIPGLFQQ
jgi:hypothetical protein